MVLIPIPTVLLMLVGLGSGSMVIEKVLFEDNGHHEFALEMQEEIGVGTDGVPVALAHGMGDACVNPGFKQITELVGKRLNVYSKCIPDGEGQEADTVNAFFTTMWSQVDYFAKMVRADAKFKDGFNAIGLSQGNLVIRGYIHKYNDPPVKKHLSICGPMSGAGSLPRCDPIKGIGKYLCEKVTDLVGDAAYTSLIQNLVAQSNYLKIPTELEQYYKYNKFLTELNNEVPHNNSASYKSNFEKLEKLILVKALEDSMVYPRDSEWFGFFEDGSWDNIVQFNETKAYKENTFGLKTLIEADKVAFRSYKGDHLRFTLEELYGWLDEFF